jgi:adenylate/nucleoside-diphosphate kinase
MENMNYDRIYQKKSLSQYGFICPVTWRQSKSFVNCCQRTELTVLYQERFYYFAGKKERAIFLKNPTIFTDKVLFSSDRNVPSKVREHKASEIVAQEKALAGHCPVTLKDEERIEKGHHLIVVNFKDARYIFASQEKAAKFFFNPSRYCNVQLPVKMPAGKDPVSLFSLQKQDDSITFMEQALGQVVTRGLREVGENRLKYPTLSVKETMLKLFAIFLKAENPANTEYMREKYHKKMKDFIYRCEVPVELFDMAQDRCKKDKVWPDFKEDYYNKLGAKYDSIMKEVAKERSSGFSTYIK